MRISKGKIWLFLTIVLGLLTTFLVMRYLQGAKPAAAEPMGTVVIAVKKVPEGTKITAEMLKTKEVPQKYLPAGSFDKTDKVVNQFTTVELYPDQVIINGQIASENTAKELTYKVPEGQRAITVAVNSLSGVAGHIKPGNYVDVLLNYDKPDPAKTDQPDHEKKNVLTLLQNVRVLAVGPDLQKKEGVQTVENITLAVSPDDAEKVALSENIGKLKLTLRPISDKKEVSLPRMDFKKLEAQYP